MQDLINQIKDLATKELQDRSVDIENLKIKYLGKKGRITELMKKLRDIPGDQRPELGLKLNQLRTFLEERFDEKLRAIKQQQMENSIKNQSIDITIDGKRRDIGKLHPFSQTQQRIFDFFTAMGFSIHHGPEIETAYYNFEALNIDADHPARDEQDTFYINEDILLRTQTSPMQIRVMEGSNPPIKMLSPGKVFRSDAVDATHSPVFHQIEGLVVDKGITFANLKGILETFIKYLYGDGAKVRFRPHHFPFTEPSAEVDVACFMCGGKGCGVCKGEGYIEILGCGMVHPKVLSRCNIDPEVYSGYAFGMGVERIVMRDYRIGDMRLLYENDVRFLRQF